MEVGEIEGKRRLSGGQASFSKACRSIVCFCQLVSFWLKKKKHPSNGTHPRHSYSSRRSVWGLGQREQKYLCTGKAASPARAMPRLSPTLAAAMANSLCLSSVCGREDRWHFMYNDVDECNDWVHKVIVLLYVDFLRSWTKHLYHLLIKCTQATTAWIINIWYVDRNCT